MLLSLVDSLRCPAVHDEWPLVLTADAWRDGRVWTGRLGCPRCGAEFTIRDGVADFTGASENDASPFASPRDEEVLRVAALLDLREPGGIVLLTGRYAAFAGALGERVEACYVTLDAPATAHPLAVSLRIAGRLPLAVRSLRGAALDVGRSDPPFVAHTVSLMRSSGRLVALASVPVPEGVQVLASDDREWVAEVDRESPPMVPLRRK